jgi:hypothetical protein
MLWLALDRLFVHHAVPAPAGSTVTITDFICQCITAGNPGAGYKAYVYLRDDAGLAAGSNMGYITIENGDFTPAGTTKGFRGISWTASATGARTLKIQPYAYLGSFSSGILKCLARAGW